MGRNFACPEDVIERFRENFSKGVTIAIGTWKFEIVRIKPISGEKCSSPEKQHVALLIRVERGVPHPYVCPVKKLSTTTGRHTVRAEERATDELIRSLVFQ
jgi:hypothetical protein